jgi:transcriptional regulator with XRE-family HTH domain
MQDWKRIVGSNIRYLRNARDLSQETLAFKAGIHLTYLGGIERGKRNPSLLVLARIAKALSVSPADLLRQK